jgi:DNA-binding response OmpR family regulator
VLRWAAWAALAGAALTAIGGATATGPRRGRTRVAAVLLVAAALAGAATPWRFRRAAGAVPRIHDITTDTQDPPAFVALRERPGATNPVEYGGPEIAAQQRAGYPDLAPDTLPVPPREALARAEAAARALGWAGRGGGHRGRPPRGHRPHDVVRLPGRRRGARDARRLRLARRRALALPRGRQRRRRERGAHPALPGATAGGVTGVPRILIVEDTSEIAEALQHHLERRGYETALATRAAQAAAVIAGARPDLIVLDLGLPDRDGYTVLEQLRARGHDTPVLILSARREEADKLRGFTLGADDYVTKPFSAMELLARVAALLRRAEARAPAAAPLPAAAGAGPTDEELQARFGLTERQVAVARLLAEGCSNVEVAERLGVSEHTARNHTMHVMGSSGRPSGAHRADPARAGRLARGREGERQHEPRPLARRALDPEPPAVRLGDPRAIASPSPSPRRSAWRACQNAPKMCCASSGEMPRAVVAHRHAQLASAASQASVTSPPRGRTWPRWPRGW